MCAQPSRTQRVNFSSGTLTFTTHLEHGVLDNRQCASFAGLGAARQEMPKYCAAKAAQTDRAAMGLEYHRSCVVSVQLCPLRGS